MAAPPPPAPVQQSTVTRTGVDINTATVAELQKLPGVNKLQAQRIFAMRPFLSIQDLIRTGLPQKTINNLKPAAKGPQRPPGEEMSRILLVDDSPHAQRMGERILSDEGYEVVTVSNADSALIRLEDVDPDVVVADAVMPGRTGYEICQYLKMSPRHRHVRVILTVRSAGADR